MCSYEFVDICAGTKSTHAKVIPQPVPQARPRPSGNSQKQPATIKPSNKTPAASRHTATHPARSSQKQPATIKTSNESPAASRHSATRPAGSSQKQLGTIDLSIQSRPASRHSANTRKDNGFTSGPTKKLKETMKPTASSRMQAPAIPKKKMKRDLGSSPLPSHPSAPINKKSYDSRLPQTPRRAVQFDGVVKVIPVSGSMKFPEIPLKVGSATWQLLFSNLTVWLPELAGIEDENSVMLQYQTDNGWRPLAGDEQLKRLLDEFDRSGWQLHVRCAPQDEFESSSEKGEHEYGSRGLVVAFSKENKSVSHAVHHSISSPQFLSLANGN